MQMSCGLPKQETDLHKPVLSSQGACTRELISLQPSPRKNCICGSPHLFVVISQEEKDGSHTKLLGSRHQTSIIQASLKIEGGVLITSEIQSRRV